MSLRFIVVDDNPGDIELVEVALAELRGDAEVLAAPLDADPADFLCARARPEDIILLDINMPRMDGFAVLARVRLARPELRRIVMLSGSPNPRDRERALALGAVTMIRKPDRFAEWATVLAEVLRCAGQGDGAAPSP